MNVTNERPTRLIVARIRRRLLRIGSQSKDLRTRFRRGTFVKLRTRGRLVHAKAVSALTAGRLVKHLARVCGGLDRLYQRLFTNASVREGALPPPIIGASFRNGVHFNAQVEYRILLFPVPNFQTRDHVLSTSGIFLRVLLYRKNR